MESESVLDYNVGNEESEDCSNESLEGYVRQLLLAIGEEPKREGLLKTPLRAAKSIRYLLEGYFVSVESVISGAVFHTDWGNEPIVVHLEVFSTGTGMDALCPEAIQMSIAYIPDVAGSGRVLGLSKLARVAGLLSRRLTDGDAVMRATANALYSSASLKPQGVAVSVKSEKSRSYSGERTSDSRVILGHFPNQEDLEILLQQTHSFPPSCKSNAVNNRREGSVSGEGIESLIEVANKILRSIVGCRAGDNVICSAAYGIARRFIRIRESTQLSRDKIDDECRKLLEPIYARRHELGVPIPQQLQTLFITPVPLSSTCEHHLLPFDGYICVALHLPYELTQSEYRRALEKAFQYTVASFSGKLQLQERLTNDICESFFRVLEGIASGVLIFASASHCCMSARGVKQANSRTNTVSARGVFSDDKTLRKVVLAEAIDFVLSSPS